jgi:Domain of unknown function (DUF6754)
MPNPADLVNAVVTFIGDQVNQSSLRLGPVPAISVFLVGLVILSLLARPTTRWATRDLGRLGRVGRAMALAAESGAAATFSLGTAGVVRATSAMGRIQTLAALRILGHVARSAARSGVPLRVTTNDPVAAHLAEAAIMAAHVRTETVERAERSRVEYVGEGRAVAAAAALADVEPVSASFVIGGLAEESLLLAMGRASDAAWSSVGTAAATQAATPELTGDGAMIGPELFLAASDLQPAGRERTGVQAGNRLVVAAIVILAAGSLIAVLAGVDVASAIAGH